MTGGREPRVPARAGFDPRERAVRHLHAAGGAGARGAGGHVRQARARRVRDEDVCVGVRERPRVRGVGAIYPIVHGREREHGLLRSVLRRAALRGRCECELIDVEREACGPPDCECET